MKKKILALALCLVMLLSLAFIGCDDEEAPPPPPPPPTESILSNIDFLDNKVGQTTITKVDFTDKNQGIQTINDYFYGQMIVNLGEDNTPVSQTYKLFNVNNSTVISLTVNPYMDEENEAYSSTITDISYNPLEARGEFLFVIAEYGDGEKCDAYLYNKNGVAVAEYKGISEDELNIKKSSDYQFNSNNSSYLMSFMKKVYLVNEDDATITELVDLNKASFNFDEVFYYEELDAFIAVDEYGNLIEEIIVFDKTLKITSHYEFIAQYDAIDAYSVTFNDSEILYIEFLKLPEDATDYDLVYEGYKANLKMKKVNFLTGEETDVAYNGFIPSNSIYIQRSDEEMAKYYGYGLKADIKNAFSYCTIEDKFLVEKQNIIVTDENLNIVKYIDPFKQGDAQLYTTLNGMKILATDFGSYFIDNEGNLTSLIPNDFEQNNLWIIVDEKEVYDATNTLIYTVPEGREIEYILNNSLIISEEVKNEAGEVTAIKNYLWKGVGNEVQIGTDLPEVQPTEGVFTAVMGADGGYYTMATMDMAKMMAGDMSMTITMYDDLGTELVKLDNVTDSTPGSTYGDIEQILFEITNKAEDGTVTTTYTMLVIKNAEVFLNQGE